MSSWPPGETYGRNLLLTCRGTQRYPGCGAKFLAGSHKSKFCEVCGGLDRASSFVFVERRRARDGGRCAACGGPADQPAVDNTGRAYLGCRSCTLVLPKEA